jgi:hypothetical protein
MQPRTSCISAALVLIFALPLSVGAANKKASTTEQPSYAQPQPQRESLDLNMYQRIRLEGLEHSHVLEYASALADGIGPRLTGSQNLAKANAWTREQFTAMGCVNAHLED